MSPTALECRGAHDADDDVNLRRGLPAIFGVPLQVAHLLPEGAAKHIVHLRPESHPVLHSCNPRQRSFPRFSHLVHPCIRIILIESTRMASIALQRPVPKEGGCVRLYVETAVCAWGGGVGEGEGPAWAAGCSRTSGGLTSRCGSGRRSSRCRTACPCSRPGRRCRREPPRSCLPRHMWRMRRACGSYSQLPSPVHWTLFVSSSSGAVRCPHADQPLVIKSAHITLSKQD